MSKMYNEELKIRFIQSRAKEVTLPLRYLEREFEKIAPFETKLEKDVCNFSFYDIIDYYKFLNLTSIEGIEILNSQFLIYTDWCFKQNLVNDGQNHFRELRRDDYYNCINKAKLNMSIFDREDILNLIDDLPNPKDQFIILALFEGIKGKDFSDLTLLKPEHISGNIITLPSGKNIQVSDELIDYANKTIEEQSYYSMSGKMEKVIPLTDLGYIIKSYPNVDSTIDDLFQIGRRLYKGLMRLFAFLGMEHIKANDIYNSGMIYSIKENAKKHNMSCKDYIYSEYFEPEIEERYKHVNDKKNLLKKYEDCL